MGSFVSSVGMETLVGGAMAIALLLIIGRVWGRSGRAAIETASAEAAERATRAEAEARELQRAMTRMRREHGPVINLALALPSIIHDMNRADLEPRNVPKLILRLADAMFQPGQVLLYGLQSGPGGRRELVLVEHRGLAQVPPALQRVQLGEGKIGWIAQHELEMVPDDWAKLLHTERREVPDNHAALDAEIIGPLVQRESGDRQMLLGVLSMGSLGTRPADPKLMLGMVTNLGALGLVSAKNLKKLRVMANHDGLTELLNKRSFLENFGAGALMKCVKGARPFSLLIFDVDNFKRYNDQNGHPAGDKLLRELGQLIRSMARPQDLTCRYGGEEFLIGMPETEPEEAMELAQRLREAVATAEFDHREKQPMGFVSISGGVAAYPRDGSRLPELIQCADQALYLSKNGGRNQVTRHEGVTIGAVESV